MDEVSFEADGWVEMGEESWRCRGGGGRSERDVRGVLRRCEVRLRERILGDWSTAQLFLRISGKKKSEPDWQWLHWDFQEVEDGEEREEVCPEVS